MILFDSISSALLRMSSEGALPSACALDSLSHDTEIAELGIDSLGALILVAELESALGARIPDGLFSGVRTLGQLEQRLRVVKGDLA